MNDAEKRLLRGAVNTLERLYFENLALNLILERCSPPNWKAARDKIMNDSNVQADVREMFAQFSSEIEEKFACDSTLEELAWVLPTKGKPI